MSGGFLRLGGGKSVLVICSFACQCSNGHLDQASSIRKKVLVRFCGIRDTGSKGTVHACGGLDDQENCIRAFRRQLVKSCRVRFVWNTFAALPFYTRPTNMGGRRRAFLNVSQVDLQLIVRASMLIPNLMHTPGSLFTVSHQCSNEVTMPSYIHM